MHELPQFARLVAVALTVVAPAKLIAMFAFTNNVWIEMDGIQIERTLNLIDRNFEDNMERVRAEVLQYLKSHRDDLAMEIYRFGSAAIPTHLGQVRVAMQDLGGIA